ncbi:MAG TPA: pectate lyase [Phycisphaerae bacterium]
MPMFRYMPRQTIQRLMGTSVLAAGVTGATIFVGGIASAAAPAGATPAGPEKYSKLPAFPGAEGFGMYVTGGRGGSVYEVTTLQDNAQGAPVIHGSLRDAISQGNRTIVFNVSGTIALKSQMNVTASNITIAGQTAAGEGICLRDNQFGVGGKNIIVRYLRSRLGDTSHKEDDSLEVNNGASDIMYDHCSASWAIDECFSTSGRETNVTIQWCLIAQGLTDSFHAKGPHGYGSLARSNGNVSWIYNMWAETLERNPRLGDVYGQGRPNFDVRNNVIYNFGRVASGLIQGNINVNYVNNYIRPGPVSNKDATGIHTPGPTDNGAMPSDMTFYIKGNVWEGNDAATKDNVLFFDHTAVPGRLVTHFSPTSVVSAPPTPHLWSAEEAYKAVLDNVGANLPVRDRVDAAIVQQARDRTGSLIDTQTQAGGWPDLKSATPAVCSLHDGIPDDWKTAHGLDTKEAIAAKVGPSGYTYLEEYLNGTDPRVKVDYLDPKNNISSLKPGPSQPLWKPTAEEAAAVAAVNAKYKKMGETATYPIAPP